MRHLGHWVLVATILTACEETGALTDLQADRPSTELTLAEHTRMCLAYEKYFDGLMTAEEKHRADCTAEATLYGLDHSKEAIEECFAEVQQCLAEPAPADPDASRCEQWQVDPGCSATVGEMEACLVDYADAQAEALKDRTCNDLGGGSIPPLPDSCKLVLGICMEFYGADDFFIYY